MELVGDWRKFLAGPIEEEQLERFRRHERTGRPLGDARFLKKLERKLGRILRRQKPGPKRKSNTN